MAAQIRIGCSGWSYAHWRKRFYPEKMPAREHFAYYASHFDTVELNNSFYRQPPPERFASWRQQAPPGFLFAVKGSRYVTHIKRLAVEQKSIDMVVEPAMMLGDKLGPILFQLQANFHLDLERLERFLVMLPDRLRYTLEVRHESWLIPPVCDLLKAHRVALCIPDHPKIPQLLAITADFTYIRMHLPPHGLGYGRKGLTHWGERILQWQSEGIDVFVYFNNDMEGHAVKDGQTLKQLIAEADDPGHIESAGLGLREARESNRNWEPTG